MTNLRYITGFIVVFGLFSCAPKTNKTKDKPPVTVDVIIAKKVNYPTSIEVNGSALSEEMIELHPEISGRLTYVNLPDGSFVNEGTVLAKINDAELQAQKDFQQLQLDLAVKTEQRLAKLLEVNGVNQSDYDAALNQVHTLRANINILQAQLDKTVVKASFSGTLGLRMVSRGAYVTPQTILGTLQQTDQIKIDFTVPDSYANLVFVGSNIQIDMSRTAENLSAVVDALEPQMNSDTRNFKVRARLASGKVNPGAFVKVLLTKEAQTIVVPSNAIIPDAVSNQVVLFKNNKGAFVNVETGIRDANIIEILNGVHEGDTIVVSGMLFVRPNATLKIRNVLPQLTSELPDAKQIAE